VRRWRDRSPPRLLHKLFGHPHPVDARGCDSATGRGVKRASAEEAKRLRGRAVLSSGSSEEGWAVRNSGRLRMPPSFGLVPWTSFPSASDQLAVSGGTG